MLSLYKDTYSGLNIRHFHEKLRDEHGIELSDTWAQEALQAAGVGSKRHKRRPLVGMLLHIDGTKHRCLNDERWYDLIVILDDANTEIYYAQGTHFCVTTKEGKNADKQRLTQVWRAMKELAAQMIAAYSPQARSRSRGVLERGRAVCSGASRGRH